MAPWGRYWAEWAHIESAFVSVAVGLDTTHLTEEQRLRLPLLLETMSAGALRSKVRHGWDNRSCSALSL